MFRVPTWFEARSCWRNSCRNLLISFTAKSTPIQKKQVSSACFFIWQIRCVFQTSSVHIFSGLVLVSDMHVRKCFLTSFWSSIFLSKRRLPKDPWSWSRKQQHRWLQKDQVFLARFNFLNLETSYLRSLSMPKGPCINTRIANFKGVFE